MTKIVDKLTEEEQNFIMDIADIVLTFLILMSKVIPRFYLKVRRPRIRMVAKVFWCVLVWGIALIIAGGIVFGLMLILSRVFGWLPRF